SLTFFHHTPSPDIYTLSLHDALPISRRSAAAGSHESVRRERSRPRATPPSAPHRRRPGWLPVILLSSAARHAGDRPRSSRSSPRSEEHTSELQSQSNLVCRLLLEKKK